MTRKKILKTIAFAAVLLVLTMGVSALLKGPGTSRANYQWIHGFYDEPDRSLDGVLIGASNAYCSWIAPLAWERYGIAVWPFTSSRQPFLAAKDMIAEARKTQPDAVYIVTIGSPDPVPESEGAIHDLIDFMPLSVQKLHIIDKLCDSMGYSFSDRLEFYFPLLRFHSHWSDLEQIDFMLENDGMKGVSTRAEFYRKITNVSDKLRMTEMREKISADMENALEELFQYCESEQVKLLFVISPIARGDLDELAQLNTVRQICQDRGFPVLDEREAITEIGLDPARDYYDNTHTNIHGGIKLTEYLARYLLEHYGLQDKRGTPGYASWDTAYERCREHTGSYTLDFEWENSRRDTALAAPKITELNVSGTTMTVSWQAVDGAEGYRLYRKPVTEDEDPPGWELIAEVDRDTLKYKDTGLEADAAYCYTAVAFRKEDGAYIFGRVLYNGASDTALLDAPKALELSGAEDAVTLSWKKVKGADGYEISRGIPADIADRIETDVGKETSFRDTLFLPGVPYGYQVRAYRCDEAGEKVYGSWSAETVWVPERSGPDVAVELVDGIPTLTWESMAGVTGYWVNRKEGSGDWEPATADALPPGCTTFQDITARKGVEYTYSIQAYLEYEGETYRYNSQAVKITAKKTGIELPAPAILLCEQVEDKIYTVWEPVESAANYRVYRYRWDEETETWVDMSTVKITNPACQQSPAKSGRYLFVVRALYDNGDYANLGQYDESMGCVVEYRKSE